MAEEASRLGAGPLARLREEAHRHPFPVVRRRRNWLAYSPGMRKGFLYRVAGAKRPETRAARIAQIVDIVARNVSRAELMERAGFRKKKAPTKRTKT